MNMYENYTKYDDIEILLKDPEYGHIKYSGKIVPGYGIEDPKDPHTKFVVCDNITKLIYNTIREFVIFHYKDHIGPCNISIELWAKNRTKCLYSSDGTQK